MFNQITITTMKVTFYEYNEKCHKDIEEVSDKVLDLPVLPTIGMQFYLRLPDATLFGNVKEIETIVEIEDNTVLYWIILENVGA